MSDRDDSQDRGDMDGDDELINKRPPSDFDVEVADAKEADIPLEDRPKSNAGTAILNEELPPSVAGSSGEGGSRGTQS